MRLLRLCKRLFLVLVLLGAGAFPFVDIASAQGSECQDLPTVTVNRDIHVSAEYYIWVLAKKESADAWPYVRVNNGECRQFAIPEGFDWEWVSGESGVISQQLNAGNYDFALSVNNGAFLIDKLLITSSNDCVPTGTGDNCIEEPLNFSVQGITQGETIYGSREVSVQLTSESMSAEIEMAFDGGAPVTTSTTQPYCLVAGDDDCGAYDFSQLGEGSHILNVKVRSGAGQELARNIPFEVASQASAPRPPAVEEYDVPKEPIPFELLGIKDGETLTGEYTVSVAAPAVMVPISMTFQLDAAPVASRTQSPYCLVSGKQDMCGVWDSATVSNGTHNLSVIANAPGYAETRKAITFNVDNPPLVSEEVIAPGTTDQTPKAPQEEQPKPAMKEVVVGGGTQQTTGKTKVTVPASRTKPGHAITFKVDDKEVGRATPQSPSVIIDTEKLTNGRHRISAVVQSPGGEEEVLSSDIEVRNNLLTSWSNYARQHPQMAAGIFVVIAAMLFTATFVVTRMIRRKKFLQKHNISDAYSKEFSPLAQGTNLQRGIMYGGMSVMLLLVGFVTFMRLGNTVMAAGLGFIAEVEDGVTTDNSEFAMLHDDSMQRIYMRLVHGGDAPVEPEHPHHPTDPEPDPPTTPSDQEPTTPTPPPASGPVQSLPTTCNPSGGMGPMGPCINNALIPVGRTGHSTAMIDRVSPITRLDPGQEAGAFRQRCDFSHMNYDDAILYPGTPQAAHLHTYFGNTLANAYSTSETLFGSGNSTCAGGTVNRSAYWIPTMIDTTTGRPIAPKDDRSRYHSDLEIYYKLGYQGVGYRDVVAFPNGLQMIAGNASNASGPTPNSRVRYYCETPDPASRFFSLPSHSAIPNCPRNHILVMTVDFPQCWDGRNLKVPNGRSHLVYGTFHDYPATTRGCPASHPVGIPSVLMIARWRVETENTSRWRLSSDNYTHGPGGYSGHADYVFAWDPTAFPTVKKHCYEALVDCYYQFGDGREPRWVRSQ